MAPAEYLAMERASPDKHEFFGGEVFAMAGSTPAHSLITANVLSELRAGLRRGTCRVYTSDMKVHVPPTGLFAYPDAIVVCGRLEFVDAREDVLTNPKVLVEVLSDSTEKYDRGEKFASYREIRSLEDYLLVSQHEARVEHFARQPDGSWLLREARAGGRVRLASVGCDLTIEEVYLKVFGEAEAS
jgi:Uma2 family endonuclease